MTDTTKNELFETAKVTTVIRMFALPAIASSLIGSVSNIVDQIFIGQKIGTLGNAATNVAFPLVMLMVIFSMLIGVGGSSNFSMEIGSGEHTRASRTAGNSVFCMALFGIILMIVTLIFLRPSCCCSGPEDRLWNMQLPTPGLRQSESLFISPAPGFPCS